MKNWEDDDNSEYCSSNIDFLDAASVADVLGIEIEHVNFAAEYKDRVFAEFLREYQGGRTPNPDILCNAEIKFKAFLDHAMRLGAEKIATGHYARVREVDGQFQLLKGLDASKDQSYFLHRLNQSQLAKTLFPVGELEKTEVRRIADAIGLPNAKKKDSTGICFIGERPFREFLNRYIANEPQKRTRPAHWRARRLELLHLGTTPRAGHWRLESQRTSSGRWRTQPMVCRPQRPRDQHLVCRARPRPPLVNVSPADRRQPELVRWYSSKRRPLRRKNALPTSGCGLCFCGIRRYDATVLYRSTMGCHPWPIGGFV